MGDAPEKQSTPRRTLVVHPILFALFPVLSVYHGNLAEVPLREVLAPMGFVLLATCAWFLVALLLFRRVRKAGIFVSVSLVLCFSFGPTARLISNHFYTRLSTTMIYLLCLWSALLLASALTIWRVRKPMRNATRILNVVGLVLVSMPLAGIVAHRFRASRADRRTSQGAHLARPPEPSPGGAPANRARALRDIYYIIPDRYPSARTLREFYNFDNSEFLTYLADRGFYVARESKANYLRSAHSLASSLNLRYLDFPPEAHPDSWIPLYHMIQDHKIGLFLKGQGYRYVHIGSWWYPTSENRHADVNLCRQPLSEFSMAVYKTTVFYPIGFKLSRLGDQHRPYWETARHQFEGLQQALRMEGPTFVFVHLIVPHPPFVFDRDGAFLSEEARRGRTHAENFTNQLLAVNDRLKAFVDTALSAPGPRPIIIIQSDEGPYPRRYAGHLAEFQWRQATGSELRRKMGILNAYYLPEGGASRLYPSISPVNTFRLVCDHYFGTSHDLLPDRSFAFENDQHLYTFFDVTNKAR